MKKFARRGLLLLLTIALIVSAFCISSFAAQSQPFEYSSEYNSGERDVVCTTLEGTSASSYYAGSYTYDSLSSLSANALKSSLATLMKSTHTYTSSYNDCHYEANRTDCENETGKNDKLSLIYTDYTATMSQWNGWNREHVWPQSLGGDNTSGGGADLHHIRPSDAGVNSSRGNKKYGEAGDNATSKYGSNPATGYLGGTYNNTYFEPNDNVKGDVARICLYVYVRWGSAWGADDITKVFQSIDVLLDWCELDPVDTWEMGRNEVVQDIQGNRNVFIDYPEYAWILFDREVPDDMTTPSGMAKSGTGSGSTGSGTTGGETGGNTGNEGGNTSGGNTSSESVTVTTNIATYASANGWTNDTKYTSVIMDSNVTVSVSGGGNTGKYYTSGTNWRLYQTESSKLTIQANNGCTISNVKISYTSTNTGELKNGSTSVSSGSTVVVNADSITLSVGNSGSATNGQARITAIEVTYTLPGNACQHTNTKTTTVNATCTAAGSTTITCLDCDAVVSTETIPATGHSFSGGICTNCGTEKEVIVCTFAGAENFTEDTLSGTTVTMPSAPTLSASYSKSYTFVGWTTSDLSDTATAPTIYKAGDEVEVTKSTTFYALYTYTVAGSSTTTQSYKETALANIKSTDVVVITMTKGSTVYALSNDKGTSAAPTAVVVTVSGGKLSADPASNLLWNISNSGGNLTIYVNGTTAKWLYCTSTNNGVRVGTNANKTFTVDSSSGYLKNTATSRYVGVYTTNPDWRCYTSTSTNINDQTLKFYVLTSETSGGASTTYYTTNLTLSGDCKHPSTIIEREDATCTQAGFEKEICYVCDHVFSNTEIPAIGHNYVDGTCTNCGHEDAIFPYDINKEYNLYVEINGVKYYVTGTVTSKTFGATTNVSQAAAFKIDQKSAGEYTISFYDANNVKQYIVLLDNDSTSCISLTKDVSEASVFNWSKDRATLIDATTERSIAKTNNDYFGGYKQTSVGFVTFVADVVEPIDPPTVDPDPTPEPEEPESTPEHWELVTDASTLKAGDKIIIVAANGTEYFVAGGISSQVMASLSVSVSDGIITELPSGTVELILGGSSGAWTLKNSSEKLLGATANKKLAWGSGTTTWTISISNDKATIQNSNSSFGRFLYNVTAPRFTTYTSDTNANMLLPQVFRYVPATSNTPETEPEFDCEAGRHNENEYGYCKICGLAIRTASLVLGNDLSFQFGVNIVDKNINTEGAYMQFHFNGTVTTVAEFKTNGEYIYFIFDGISPDQMTASITAILFIDGSEAAKLENYSVEKNLRGILATTTDATLVELIHKTLLYGQAAQNYHENENPAIDDTGLNTDGVTANQSDAMTLQGNSSANPIRITAVGVHFDRYNSYYVKIYVADVAEFDSLTVDGAAYGLSDMYNMGDGYYQFYFGTVDATNFDTRVTVELNSTSQGTVTRLTYSINAYAYAVAGDANADADMKALAHALYNYGKAAEAYYNAHKPQA